MAYAIQGEVFFRNASRRNNALNQINTRFASSEQWGNPEAVAITNRAGEPGVHFVARFVNKADRDAMFSQLDQAFGTGTNGPVAGSKVWIHDCPHDVGIGACTVAETREW